LGTRGPESPSRSENRRSEVPDVESASEPIAVRNPGGSLKSPGRRREDRKGRRETVEEMGFNGKGGGGKVHGK